MRGPQPHAPARSLVAAACVVALTGWLAARAAPAPPASAPAATRPTDAAIVAAAKKHGLAKARVLARIAATDRDLAAVLDAHRGAKRLVVAMSLAPPPAPPLDLIVVDPKGATVEASAEPFAGLGALVDVATTLRHAGKGGASREETRHALLRVDAAGRLDLACSFSGSNESHPGAACGSGGWDRVDYRPLPPASSGARAFIVRTDSSGTWSVKDATGRCVTRSPVRSGPRFVRYELPAAGLCTPSPATAADWPGGATDPFGF